MNPVNIISIVILVSVLVIVFIWQIYRFVKDSKVRRELSLVISSEIDIKFLEVKILKALNNYLKISSSSILLLSDFLTRPISSLDDVNSPNIKYAKIEGMTHQIKSVIIYEKIKDPVIKDLFKELNIKLVLPLKVSDEDVGLLILGPRKSGSSYSKRDVKFLESIATQISLSLKNADSYRKIRDFSQTLENKVIERTRQLEESQLQQLKLKDEFVFIATHDLATPVTAISGFTALISNRKEQVSPELAGYLSAISEASARLKVLVNDLLQVARSESGTIKIALEPLDAKQIIEAAVRQITPLASEKKINIILSLSSDNNILAEPKKLSEICENLLSNGVKYNKDGGSLTITSKVDNDKYLLEFKDTGFGIPSSEQSRVFTKFFRSESAIVRQLPGTGLGLFVVRMLIEKLGGKISFKSVEGQGTIFKLILNRPSGPGTIRI